MTKHTLTNTLTNTQDTDLDTCSVSPEKCLGTRLRIFHGYADGFKQPLSSSFSSSSSSTRLVQRLLFCPRYRQCARRLSELWRRGKRGVLCDGTGRSKGIMNQSIEKSVDHKLTWHSVSLFVVKLPCALKNHAYNEGCNTDRKPYHKASLCCKPSPSSVHQTFQVHLI